MQAPAGRRQRPGRMDRPRHRRALESTQKIVAALVWYDEHPEDLAACVRGVANIADKIVAVDGAYRRYPDAQISSPPEQAEAIRDTAAELGLEADVVIPDHLWAGQVEKRSFLLARASIDADWIAVVDSDWIIHTDRDLARAEIARQGRHVDVIGVSFYTPPGEGAAPTKWHEKMTGRRVYLPHLYRPLPELRVETRHWWYSALKDGQRVWMWHEPDRTRRVLLPRRLRTKYEIEHRCLARDEKHILAGRAFCNDRVMVLEQTGQEDDVPGLPAPVFDYETVPY